MGNGMMSRMGAASDDFDLCPIAASKIFVYMSQYKQKKTHPIFSKSGLSFCNMLYYLIQLSCCVFSRGHKDV